MEDEAGEAAQGGREKASGFDLKSLFGGRGAQQAVVGHCPSDSVFVTVSGIFKFVLCILICISCEYILYADSHCMIRGLCWFILLCYRSGLSPHSLNRN